MAHIGTDSHCVLNRTQSRTFCTFLSCSFASCGSLHQSVPLSRAVDEKGNYEKTEGLTVIKSMRYIVYDYKEPFRGMFRLRFATLNRT